MRSRRILSNAFGRKPNPATTAGLAASLPDGKPTELPGRYLIMRQHDIDVRAGKRGIRMAKAKQAVATRLAYIWNEMREANEVRRSHRERQIERRNAWCGIPRDAAQLEATP